LINFLKYFKVVEVLIIRCTWIFQSKLDVLINLWKSRNLVSQRLRRHWISCPLPIFTWPSDPLVVILRMSDTMGVKGGR